MTITLKAARVNAGYKQIDIATKLGISKTTVISWEKGRTAPRADQLVELSKLYGISMDYLFLPVKTTLSNFRCETA